MDAARARFQGLLEHAGSPLPKVSERDGGLEPCVEFAVVFPDGILELRTAAPDEMRSLAGARSGSPGHMVLEQAPFVTAFVSRRFDRARVPENPVATTMLDLFGAGIGKIDGNVLFTQTDPNRRFAALQPGVRELIEAAHEAGRIGVAVDAWP